MKSSDLLQNTIVELCVLFTERLNQEILLIKKIIHTYIFVFVSHTYLKACLCMHTAEIFLHDSDVHTIYTFLYIYVYYASHFSSMLAL